MFKFKKEQAVSLILMSQVRSAWQIINKCKQAVSLHQKQYKEI